MMIILEKSAHKLEAECEHSRVSFYDGCHFQLILYEIGK